MSDLMKLTPEELRALSPEQLLRWLLVFQGCGEWYAETHRRLERLEQCEAERDNMRLERDMLQKSVDQFAREEKEQKLLQERTDYMLNSALSQLAELKKLAARSALEE